MSNDCFQWRQTGTCRYGASCKFDHGGVAVAGPPSRPGMGQPEITIKTSRGGGSGKKREERRRKRSRSRDRGRHGRRRSSPRGRDRGRRRKSRSPDPFGRNVRRRSSSIEREEAQRNELRRQQEVKKQEEARRKREREKELKRELRELTASARWDGEGVRPPGTDLSLYRLDKDMGYVAKNKCWVFTPGEPNLWYEKRTGRYYVYSREEHAYLYSHGGVDPTYEYKMKQAAPQPTPQGQPDAAAAAATTTTTVDASTGGAWASASGNGSDSKKTVEAPQVRNIHFATESWAGRKDTLEDRYTEEETVSNLGRFYGLFDGHGGSACADYACKRIHKQLATAWGRYRKSSMKEAAAVAEAFTETFAAVDDEYLKISQKKSVEDGSTAVCALVVGDFKSNNDSSNNNSKGSSSSSSVSGGSKSLSGPPRLYTANLGDSRAILCRGGEAIQLTKDHKPNDREEKKRIEGCGGKVVEIGTVWRVTKRDVSNRPTVKVFLSTSRSLGDRQLKIPDPLVSGVPDVKMIRLSPEDYFMVLVCDGVTDVMSDQQVVDIVCDNLDDVERAAKSVVKASYKTGSKDNLTAMVVRFTCQCEGAEATIKKYREARRAREEVSRQNNYGGSQLKDI